MQRRPVVKISYGRQNEPLAVPISDLLLRTNKTFLIMDCLVGSISGSVQVISDLAVSQVLFIGNPGIGNSEIIKTDPSTAPTGNTVTFAAVTTQTHQSNSYVYVLDFDQIEFSYSATLTGAKSVLATVPVNSDSTETYYNDTTQTSGFYFARFKNSITSAFSDYSDGCPIGEGYYTNTARYIIDSALAEIGKKTSGVFNDEYCFMQINNCQRVVMKQLKRWSWMKVYGATLPAAVGTWRAPLPQDIDDTNTNKSIENLTIGDTSNLTWVDKNQWNDISAGVYWTMLASTLNIGDTVIYLSTSNDFDSTGTITIGSSTLSYTANNTTTGVLTLSAVSAVTFPTGQDVFQNISQGTPQYATYFDGYLWHYPAIDQTYDKKNYTMDYYSKLTRIKNDTDTIVVPDEIMVINYLKWKLLVKMNSGQEDGGSMAAKQDFWDAAKKLKQTEVSGVRIVMKPRFNDYSKLMSRDGDSKSVRTQGYWPTNY